ncbi:hypothetical protein K443DRAFT_10878 [Laccaria amethystina LaAM-08-1]|uniref:Uncharacterized protein n=1 Tax=Laccaria amethystina LaAM-08-1 TaxID=1095629 RepID=A0A0C9X4C4_9AGAR|nr:hypothetical protein K443DRAFT_10878 [Laccaria amethystina LaAM-08-1]
MPQDHSERGHLSVEFSESPPLSSSSPTPSQKDGDQPTPSHVKDMRSLMFVASPKNWMLPFNSIFPPNEGPEGSYLHAHKGRDDGNQPRHSCAEEARFLTTIASPENQLPSDHWMFHPEEWFEGPSYLSPYTRSPHSGVDLSSVDHEEWRKDSSDNEEWTEDSSEYQRSPSALQF